MRKLLKSSPVLLVVVLIASIVALPVGGSEAKSTRTERVSVKDNVFSPKSLRIHRRTKVVWRWKGSNPHNVRFRRVPSGASKRGSKTQSSGRFARTFPDRGRYSYVCTIHEALGMKGSIRVR